MPKISMKIFRDDYKRFRNNFFSPPIIPSPNKWPGVVIGAFAMTPLSLFAKGTALSEVNTSNILNAFVSHPATGIMDVPYVIKVGQDEETRVKTLPLNSKILRRVEELVVAAVTDAKRIYKAEFKKTKNLPHLLDSTDGEWRLSEFERSRFRLESSNSQLVEFEIHKPDFSHYSIGAGWKGKGAEAVHYVSVYDHQEILTQGYQVEFLGDGLSSFLDKIGMRKKPLSQAALLIGAEICHSGQYTHYIEDNGKITNLEIHEKKIVVGGQSYDLELEDRQLLPMGRFRHSNTFNMYFRPACLGASPDQPRTDKKSPFTVVVDGGFEEQKKGKRLPFLSIWIGRPANLIHPKAIKLRKSLRLFLWKPVAEIIQAEHDNWVARAS